jgi:hypothetical protein
MVVELRIKYFNDKFDIMDITQALCRRMQKYGENGSNDPYLWFNFGGSISCCQVEVVVEVSGTLPARTKTQ